MTSSAVSTFGRKIASTRPRSRHQVGSKVRRTRSVDTHDALAPAKIESRKRITERAPRRACLRNANAILKVEHHALRRQPACFRNTLRLVRRCDQQRSTNARFPPRACPFRSFLRSSYKTSVLQARNVRRHALPATVAKLPVVGVSTDALCAVRLLVARACMDDGKIAENPNHDIVLANVLY